VAIRSIHILSIILILALILSACGGSAATPTPIGRRTTATPTPTPLPLLATVVPAGAEANPLRLMIVPVDPAGAAALEAQLEQRILESASIFVDIVLVETYGEAVTALCDTTSEIQTAAWLNGMAYAAANARNCGDATIQLERDGSTNDPALIVANAESTGSITSLRGSVFCRPNAGDFYGWLMPLLQLRLANVETSELVDIRDVEADDLIAELRQGNCAAIGMSQSAFDALRPATQAALRVVTTIDTVPYGVLMYPFQIPLGARLYLNDNLPTMETARVILTPTPTPNPDAPAATAEPLATAEATAEATPDAGSEYDSLLEPFIGTGELVRIEPDDPTIAGFSAFLASTGLDFAQLGN
jgi:hypothetical protein